MTVPLHPSAYNIGRSFNFLLEQRNWLGFNYLVDAITGLKYKQPGTPAYIISEDKWYYWKNDFVGFVPWTTGGSGGGLDTILFSSARNFDLVDDQYLRTEDGLPMNEGPLLLPEDFIIRGISVTTLANSTCTFEIHDNGVLVPGATISLTNERRKYATYNIAVPTGSELMIYNNGTSIKPKVNVLLQRVEVVELKPDYEISAGRNSLVVIDQYLRVEDGIPMNEAPELIATNYAIYGIAVTCVENSTCTFEVHNNGVLIPGATISLTNEMEKSISCDVAITAGSKLMIYNNGTSAKPRVSLLLKKI